MAGFRWMFDAGAEAYDLLTWQEDWMAHSSSMAAHFPAMGRPLEILDVGVGPGVSAMGILKRHPDARVIGLDLSARMLRRARKRVGDQVPLVQADITQLPFEDARFDVVTGHSFLYLLPDRPAAMAEIARVLRPGGVAVFLEPRRGEPFTTALRIPGGLRFKICMILWRIVSRHAGRFSGEQLEALLGTRLSAPQALTTLNGLGVIGMARREEGGAGAFSPPAAAPAPGGDPASP